MEYISINREHFIVSRFNLYPTRCIDIRRIGFYIETHDENKEDYLLLPKQRIWRAFKCKIPSLSSRLTYTYITCCGQGNFLNVNAFQTWHDHFGHPRIGMMRKIIGNSISIDLNDAKFPQPSKFVGTSNHCVVHLWDRKSTRLNSSHAQ